MQTNPNDNNQVNPNRYNQLKPKPKPKKKDRLMSIVGVGIMAFILVIAIVFMLFQMSQHMGNTHFVTLPDINTRLVSADGNSYSFGARVAIELYNNAPQISADELHRQVLFALSGMAYEDIADANSVNNARNVVRERLADTFTDEEIAGIYFSDFIAVKPMPQMRTDRFDRLRQRGANIWFDAIFGAN